MDLLRYKDFCLSLELRSSSANLSELVLVCLSLLNFFNFFHPLNSGVFAPFLYPAGAAWRA